MMLCVITAFISCNSLAQKKSEKEEKIYKVSKTDAEWKVQLSEKEYFVMRESGTERAFSSPFNKNSSEGTYICAACQTPLFSSEYKYDSGSGWPSFDREIEGNVAFSSDDDLGYKATEEHCATCGGHLGHVFNDGPRNTTGERHCINGVSLNFIPKK